MNKVYVYGTIRKGGRLNSWVGGAELIKEVVLPYYLMYDAGGYPIIIDSENEEHTILVECYEVSDDQLTRLVRMENNVGYNLRLVKEQSSGESAAIFVITPEVRIRMYNTTLGNDPIPNGEYIEYLNKMKNEERVVTD